VTFAELPRQRRAVRANLLRRICASTNYEVLAHLSLGERAANLRFIPKVDGVTSRQSTSGGIADWILPVICFVGAAGTIGWMVFTLEVEGTRDLADLIALVAHTLIFLGLGRWTMPVSSNSQA
jgi:hypothetical protein